MQTINSMFSRAICITYTRAVFQRPQIFYFEVFENSLVHINSKLHSKPHYYLYWQANIADTLEWFFYEENTKVQTSIQYHHKNVVLSGYVEKN
jgi:hypothetical protein